MTDLTEQSEYRKWNDFLKGAVVRVNFTKVDGTEREMLCTLIEDKIPGQAKPKTENTKVPSETTVRVYDLESQGWRSFRIDSVTGYHVVELV